MNGGIRTAPKIGAPLDIGRAVAHKLTGGGSALRLAPHDAAQRGSAARFRVCIP